MKISIIGNGNLAQNLSRAFVRSSYELNEIYSLNYEALKKFSSELGVIPLKQISDLNTDIDILIVAITDHAIENLLKELPTGDYVVLHTSGTLSMNIFEGLSFKNYGVFYPLYSFVKDKKTNFKDIPLMIEASNVEALNKIKEIAENLSRNVMEVNSLDRRLYHLSGVMVNNFANYLWTVTQELLEENDLDFDYLKPILKQTADNALNTSDLKGIQTGPAKRKDFKIIQDHYSILENNLPLLDLYRKMTDLIIEKHKD